MITIGRDQASTLVLAHGDVSRRHAEIYFEGGTWWLADLGSTNGTLVDDQRIGTLPLVPGPALDVLVGGNRGVPVEVQVTGGPASAPPPPAGPPVRQPLGGPGPPASLAPPPPPSGAIPVRQPPPGQLAHGENLLPGGSRAGQTIVLGRNHACDVVVDDPLVSRRHATIELGPTVVLRDLGSFNGTFVNGQRVHGVVPLRPGDEVILGNQTLTWTGQDLTSRNTRSDLTLVVENLTTVVKGNRRLIDGLSLELGPASLTAVIGPSGSGKSTTLGALTGTRPATYGNVIWQGHDLYTHYDQLRHQIGLVPQQDIQHPQLTVRQGLSYAARLRLPPDTTKAERNRRVDEVVAQMQLQRQVDNRIGTQLSGGQKKRVSIATELLTAPPLLFLDEPTSGLDPGLDRDVMHQLRGLADEGRVVVVVTHSVLALDVCDNVLVLAPGGRVAYFGPPSGVLAHFGCRDYPQVFDLLDEPDLWQRIPPPPGGRTETSALPIAANAPLPSPPSQSFALQFSTLVKRTLAVVASDKMLLAMLLLTPPLIGALSRLAVGDAGFGLTATLGEESQRHDPTEVTQRLTVLIIASALIGAVMTIWALVNEKAVFQREYAVGLSPGTYLISKVSVYGVLCFFQGVVVAFVGTVGLDGPDDGGVLGLGWFEIAIAVGMTCASIAILGIAISGLLTSSEQGMPAVIGVVMTQLVFSGAIIAVNGRAVLEQLSWLAPARWGYAASAVSVDLNRAKELGDGTLVDGEERDVLYTHGIDQYVLDLSVLTGLTLVFVLLGYLTVRRSARAG